MRIEHLEIFLVIRSPSRISISGAFAKMAAPSSNSPAKSRPSTAISRYLPGRSPA